MSQYKVVPVEPSPEMLDAMNNAAKLFDSWPAVYRAATNATPDTGYVAVRRADLAVLVAQDEHSFNQVHDARDNLQKALNNGGCVTCKPAGGTEFGSVRRQASEAKKHAEVNDLPTYSGLPCGKCGGTLRETYHGDCVACIRETKQSLVRARNARRKNEPKPE